MKPYLVLDIETGPDQDSRIPLPDFDPPANYKHPLVIDEWREKKAQEWRDASSLHAERGHVICIGTQIKGFSPLIAEEGPATEWELLQSNWQYLTEHWTNHVLVGFNLWQFDLPYLMRRSFIHRVPVPSFIRKAVTQYRPPPEICDLMLEWQLGRKDHYISLDTLARCLGVGEKNGDGANFSKLYSEDREAALKYLRNDLQLISGCYEAMMP